MAAGLSAPSGGDLAKVGAGGGSWSLAIERTVSGLGYELVDTERAGRGLLRVTIDRVPGARYSMESEFVTVDDCEAVTRQLQHVLEVEGCDYARLEVSSPGLDRPLKRPADYARFVGEAVDLTLREPFQGRRKFRGRLAPGFACEGSDRDAIDGSGWRLELDDKQALDFTLDEVREARLVPVVDFKGRRARPAVPPADDGGSKE